MTILPWQQADWVKFVDTVDTTHHAILLTGNSGTGMRQFALNMAQYIVCTERSAEQGIYCGQCQNCRLFAAATHPDIHLITSEQEMVNTEHAQIAQYAARYLDMGETEKKSKPSQVIAIDQIRKLIDHFATHTHIASHRIAIIAPADRMNINSANSLLKLLEEPPQNSILILVTAQPGRLPATIRSRCMNLPLSNPHRATSAQWLSEHLDQEQIEMALSLSNDSPLIARQLAQQGDLQQQQHYLKAVIALLQGQTEPVAVAQQLSKLDFELLLQRIHSFTH